MEMLEGEVGLWHAPRLPRDALEWWESSTALCPPPPPPAEEESMELGLPGKTTTRWLPIAVAGGRLVLSI